MASKTAEHAMTPVDRVRPAWSGRGAASQQRSVPCMHSAVLARAPLDPCPLPHPPKQVFQLSSDEAITPALLRRVLAAGHSRIPVHSGTNTNHILGLVLAKELVLDESNAGKHIRDLPLREVPFIR